MKAGWEIKNLGEICEFANGLWTGKKPPFQNVGVIRNTNFLKDGKLDDSDIVYLDVEKSQFAKRKLQYGDIILEKSGGGPKQPVGRVVIFNKKTGDFSFSNFTAVIRIVNPDSIDFNYLHKFLFYSYISGATETMQSHSTGIRNLKFEEYKALRIPIPSLPEQQRIVSILDEAFAAIDKAKANAEKNFKNSKELFESYLQGVFENKGDGWSTKQLKDVCRLITCGVAATPKYVDAKEGVPFLSAQNVKDGNVVLDKYRYISKQFHQELTKKNKPQKGDILYSRVGSKFGEAGVVEHDFEFSVYVSLTLIKPAVEILSSYYLKHFLNSRQIKELALKSVSSSGVPNLNVKDVREFPIMLPSIFQQDKIVENIELLSLETKRLESIYQQKLTDLEELKKSILQNAFNGELNTADLCV